MILCLCENGYLYGEASCFECETKTTVFQEKIDTSCFTMYEMFSEKICDEGQFQL